MRQSKSTHYYILLGLIPAVLCSLACEQSKPQTRPAVVEPEPIKPSLPDATDLPRLTGILSDLSSDDMQGRLTGTPSGDRAARYLLDALEAAELEVRTQDVRFPLFEVSGPATLQLLADDDSVAEAFAYIDDFREVDFSGSGSVTAELMFAGYGLIDGGHDSYAGLDVEGKLVAVLTGVPGGLGLDPELDGLPDQKIHWAHENGAVGVVFVFAGDLVASARMRPWETELTALDEYLELRPNYLHDDMPVAFVQLVATERLLGLSAGDLASDPTPFSTGRRVRLEINGTTHPVASCQNVFGVLPGTGPDAQEVVIIGAHYDHLGVGADGRIFNGAGDNGTGTAIVLEVATGLAMSGIRPNRTVLFAFWCAEEQGLYGSLEYGYYGTPLFPLADTVLMIQNDYIGERDGPYISHIDSNLQLIAFLGDATSSPVLPLRDAGWGEGCASDDCVFLWMGVPAYRFTAQGDHHHTADDTMEFINMKMVQRVADINLQGVINVAFQQEL